MEEVAGTGSEAKKLMSALLAASLFFTSHSHTVSTLKPESTSAARFA